MIMLHLDVIPNIREHVASLDDAVWQEGNGKARSGEKTGNFAASKFKNRLSWPAQRLHRLQAQLACQVTEQATSTTTSTTSHRWPAK